MAIAQEKLKVTTIVDIHYKGPDLVNVVEKWSFNLQRTDAALNAIKLFLLSKEGDYYGDLTRSGVAWNLIGKQMDGIIGSNTQEIIKSYITNNFSFLIIVEISVTPDYGGRSWLIQVKVVDEYYKSVGNLNLQLETQ